MDALENIDTNTIDVVVSQSIYFTNYIVVDMAAARRTSKFGDLECSQFKFVIHFP